MRDGKCWHDAAERLVAKSMEEKERVPVTIQVPKTLADSINESERPAEFFTEALVVGLVSTFAAARMQQEAMLAVMAGALLPPQKVEVDEEGKPADVIKFPKGTGGNA